MGRRVVMALVPALALLVMLVMLPGVATAGVAEKDDLDISLSASPSTVVGGSDVSFLATVTNDGQHDAHDVVVTNTLPPDASFVPEGSDGSCTQAQPGDPVICAVGTIPEDASVDVVIEATMPCVSDTLVDSAVVSSVVQGLF